MASAAIANAPPKGLMYGSGVCNTILSAIFLRAASAFVNKAATSGYVITPSGF